MYKSPKFVIRLSIIEIVQMCCIINKIREKRQKYTHFGYKFDVYNYNKILIGIVWPYQILFD